MFNLLLQKPSSYSTKNTFLGVYFVRMSVYLPSFLPVCLSVCRGVWNRFVYRLLLPQRLSKDVITPQYLFNVFYDPHFASRHTLRHRAHVCVCASTEGCLVKCPTRNERVKEIEVKKKKLTTTKESIREASFSSSGAKAVCVGLFDLGNCSRVPILAHE